MSGMLGSSGPGILGKILAKHEKGRWREKAGFSGTERQDKKGRWYNVKKKKDRQHRIGRGMLVHSFLKPGLGGKMMATSTLVDTPLSTQIQHRKGRG